MEKSVRYTFHSGGSTFIFNPTRIVFDPLSDSKRRMLDIHKDEAEFRNAPDVYILDNLGKEVELSKPRKRG